MFLKNDTVIAIGLSIALVFLTGCAAQQAATRDKPTAAVIDTAALMAAEDGARLEMVRGQYPHYQASDLHTSDYIFDQSALRRYDLWLEDSSLNALDEDPAAEEYVEGALVHDGKLLPSVGIRYKGHRGAFLGCTSGPNPAQPSGEKTCTKLSMKIKINWADSKDRFYGVKRLQFHSQNLDPSKMFERLGYWMHRQFGTAAPRSVHAKLYINGKYSGIYALTEQIDGVFVKQNFPGQKGNLYKEVWPVDSSGNAVATAKILNGLRTNRKKANVTKFALFTDAVAGLERDLEASEIDTVMRQWFDIDQLMRYIVVDRTIAADDGMFHWYCVGNCYNHNYYWFQNDDDSKITVIPWDLDNSFENLGEPKNPFTPIEDEWNQIRNNCEPFPSGPYDIPQRSAACDKLLHGATVYEAEYNQLEALFKQQLFNMATINPLLDAWSAQIESAVAEAAAAHSDQASVEDWKKAVAKLKSDIQNSLSE